MCVCVSVCQSHTECLCIWASGGGKAIICSKLLAGRGEVGETVIWRESKGRIEFWGVVVGKTHKVWKERKKKNKRTESE